MAQPYEGDCAYAFVSYARKDRRRVEAWLELLESIGCRIWFDKGLELSNDWNDGLAQRIEGASFLFFFASRTSIGRKVVNRELRHADRHGIPILTIMLDDCKLPSGLEFLLDDQRIKKEIAPEEALERMRSDLPAVLFGETQGLAKNSVAWRHASLVASGKARRVSIGIVCALVVLIAAGAFVYGKSRGEADTTDYYTSSSSILSVYTSEAMPYQKAGSYMTTSDLPLAVENSLSVDKAFSIVSFLRNAGNEAALVESTRMDILSLEPIEEPVLQYDACIQGNTLYIFAVNNGWKASDEPYELVVQPHGFTESQERISIQEICETIEAPKAIEVSACSVGRIVSLTLNKNKFKACAAKFSKQQDDQRAEMYICLDLGGDSLPSWRIVYTETEGFQIALDGGAGDNQPDYAVTLFAALDVDANPSSIIFTGVESSPLIEGKYRVETVVAPTKSCRVRCKDVFVVDGDEQETDEYDITVTAPAFENIDRLEPGVDTGGITLFEAIIKEPDASDSRLQEIAQPFRYTTDSILKRSS